MTPLEIISLAAVCALCAVNYVQWLKNRHERTERRYWQELASRPKPRWYETVGRN